MSLKENLKTYETLSEALKDLKERGYTEDLNLKPGRCFLPF